MTDTNVIVVPSEKERELEDLVSQVNSYLASKSDTQTHFMTDEMPPLSDEALALIRGKSSQKS